MKSLKDILRLFASVRINRTALFLGTLSLLATATIQLILPKLLGNLAEVLGVESKSDELNQLGVFLAIALLSSAIFQYSQGYFFVKLTAGSLTELRQRAYNHIIKLPMKFFMRASVSEIASRITSDIQVLKQFLNKSIQDIIEVLLISTGGLIMLFIVSWKLTLLVLLGIPVVFLLSKFFSERIKNTARSLQDDVASSNIIVQESLIDIYSVKSFTNESKQIEQYRNSTNSATTLDIRLGLFKGSFSLLTQIMVAVLVLAVVWTASYLVRSGELGTAEIVSYMVYMLAILFSISGAAEVFSEVQKGLGSIYSLLEVMDEKEEDLGVVTNAELSGSLRFENVSFSYPGEEQKEVLKNLNFTIPKGERWALVGASGSGKSTIASLILQMYELEHGTIYFDDYVMRDLSILDIRKDIAVVPQSSTLFSCSIRENIMYGRLDATEEEFMEVAIEASVDEFVKDLPKGYETEVGEHGMRLSGGQRQRILLARAMLKNPKILILDEATSALDSETEMLVQVAIYLLTQRCTSLIIAHRLSTVKTADNILVLEKGEIIEQGTYNELMADETSHFRHLNFLSLDA